VLTHVPWLILFGPPDELPRAMLMFAGWAINLAVAEYLIRRSPTRSARPLSSAAVFGVHRPMRDCPPVGAR
jgi:hypothetical protein